MTIDELSNLLNKYKKEGKEHYNIWIELVEYDEDTSYEHQEGYNIVKDQIELLDDDKELNFKIYRPIGGLDDYR